MFTPKIKFLRKTQPCHVFTGGSPFCICGSGCVIVSRLPADCSPIVWISVPLPRCHLSQLILEAASLSRSPMRSRSTWLTERSDVLWLPLVPICVWEERHLCVRACAHLDTCGTHYSWTQGIDTLIVSLPLNSWPPFHCPIFSHSFIAVSDAD